MPTDCNGMPAERMLLGVDVDVDGDADASDVATAAADNAHGVASLRHKKEGGTKADVNDCGSGDGPGDVGATNCADEPRSDAPAAAKGAAAAAGVPELNREPEDVLKWLIVFEVIFEIITSVVPTSAAEDEPNAVVQPEWNIENGPNDLPVAAAAAVAAVPNGEAPMFDNVARLFEAPELEPIEEEDEREYNCGGATPRCRCTPDKSRDNFKCNICGNGVRNAVITICGHLYCWPCLWQYERVRIEQTACPHCGRHIRMHEDVVPYYGGSDDDDDVGLSSIPHMVPRPSAFRFKSGASSNCWFFVDDYYRRAVYNYPRRRLENVVNRLNGNESVERWCNVLRNIEIAIIVIITLIWLVLGD